MQPKRSEVHDVVLAIHVSAESGVRGILRARRWLWPEGALSLCRRAPAGFQLPQIPPL